MESNPSVIYDFMSDIGSRIIKNKNKTPLLVLTISFYNKNDNECLEPFSHAHRELSTKL